MSGSLRLRLSAGLAAQAYNQAITIGFQLISVPLLLTFWGVERYGVWLLISAIPFYLALADLGFAQVGASDMTMRVAREDRAGAVATYHTIFAMNCVLGLIGCGAMVAFALSPLGAALVGEAHGGPDAQWALVFLAIHVLFSLLQGVIGAGLRSVGQFAHMIAFFATARLLDGILLLTTAGAGGGLLDAALAMIAGRIVITTAILVFLHHSHPWLRLGFGKASRAVIREMLSPSLYYTGYMLGNLISIQGAIVVIGAVLGPAAVAVAGTTRTLARIGVNGAILLNQIMAPEYSVRFGLAHKQRVDRLFAFHIAAVAAVALAYVVFMLLFGAQIYGWWTKSATGAQDTLLLLLVLASAGDMIWTTLQAPAISANKLRLASTAYLVASAIGLAVLFLYAKEVGVDLFGMVALGLSPVMIGVAWIENRAVRGSIEA